MDQAVRNQQFRIAGEIWPARKIADSAPGFADDQHASRGVPRFEPEFPKTLELPACDRTKIQRRRTRPANSVRSQREFPVVVDIGILRPFVTWKSGGKQTLRERLHA